MSERKTNLTTGFPDIKNGGGEVVVIVYKLWGWISGVVPGDGKVVLTHNEWG